MMSKEPKLPLVRSIEWLDAGVATRVMLLNIGKIALAAPKHQSTENARPEYRKPNDLRMKMELQTPREREKDDARVD